MHTPFPTTIEWFDEAEHGKVEQLIAPDHTGRVKYRGSFWKAELADPECKALNPGETVKVLGRHGIVLLVVPESYAVSQSNSQNASAQ
jgi:membrane-bound ClpP family serine protease